MTSEMKNATGKGGVVIQLWQADTRKYNALEATEQRFFDCFRESVKIHDDDPAPDNLAAVYSARQNWRNIYNVILASNFGDAV